MKKLLFGAAALFLMAGCARFGNSKKAAEDSARIADSIARVEAAEQARQDSLQKAQEESEFAEIQSMVKKFYESAVLRCNNKSNSYLSNYLTNHLMTKLIRMNEFDDEGVAVWYMRGDVQDCDERDKVLSVEKDGENSVIVKFLDCGFNCSVRLDVVKDNGTWKINDFKFLSQSDKSQYRDRNNY